MDRDSINKRKVIDEIVANDFAKLNGAVVRTMGNIFHSAWFRASDLKVVFKDKDEADIYFSLDYLQQSGAVSVRHIDTKESIEINDFDLNEVEIRLTADGIKLLMVRKKDELIDI
jgi:hypothetical protein